MNPTRLASQVAIPSRVHVKDVNPMIAQIVPTRFTPKAQSHPKKASIRPSHPIPSYISARMFAPFHHSTLPKARKYSQPIPSRPVVHVASSSCPVPSANTSRPSNSPHFFGVVFVPAGFFPKRASRATRARAWAASFFACYI